MSWLSWLKTAEIPIGEFFLPWGMVIGTLGFLAAWLTTSLMERFKLTRYIWHLPLFFVALTVFFGCVIGLLLKP